jgi:hypothetical protein
VTVYVDDMRMEAQVGNIKARWSHLFAGLYDPVEELHELAAAIGLRRAWFQGPPKHPWPGQHYDVTDTLRRKAIKVGAVPVSWHDTGEMHIWAYEARDAAMTLATAQYGLLSADDPRIWAIAKTLYDQRIQQRADLTIPRDGRNVKPDNGSPAGMFDITDLPDANEGGMLF